MSKKEVVTTPIGEAEWFSLVNEDKFGNYTCNLKLEDSPETHKFIAKVDSFGKEGRKPYKKNADGSYVIKLKVKSQGTKKDGSIYKVSPPVLYNSLGKKISGEELERLSVGNGSEIRAKVELSAYDFMGTQGVSCKPKAVQISKLIEFGGGSDLGFDALELEEEDEGEASESDSYDF